MKKFSIIILLGFCIAHLAFSQATVKTKFEVDACVYGAGGSGINAAVALAREGYSVVIVEPTHEIGGLLASGFRMQQDVPYPDHLGGLTGEFYQIDMSQPKPRHYQGASKYNIATLKGMIAKYGDLITVIVDHRLASVEMEDGKIKEAIFEYAPPDKNGVPIPKAASDNLTSIEAKVFVDASYEGDLMAYSGVAYRVGRESREEYGESMAGVIISKKFPGVDPYKQKGKRKSGLLSCIDSGEPVKEGDSSRYFIGYNFKFSWEENPTEEFPGIPIDPPENRNKDVYELLRRYAEAGYKTTWPNGNFKRDELLTGAVPGMQVDYPDGDWATRSRVWQDYIDHVRTLTDFYGKDVRLLTDNNEHTNGWPSMLYVRAGRRMVGEYVMAQKDIQLQTKVHTPIGMGYYKVDIYPTRLIVLKDGTLAHEGNIFVLASPGPYQIPYGALIPKKKACKNLLVTQCMSASHVAYSSIRMEATYMVMGEAAGIAGALALKTDKAVQDIDRKELTANLEKYGALLEWDKKGYRWWRYNALNPDYREDIPTRWETHPQEYEAYPVEVLWE